VTFSIVARCPEASSLGVAVASAAPAVGGRVPHVEAGVGAIATQGNTDVTYGVSGLKLLKRGFSPRIALSVMLKKDERHETRQVIIIDKNGRKAAFTGKETIDWTGHLMGKDYVVAGNILVGKQVIESMAHTFENTKANLEERLLAALEAGQNAGGDKRGKTSAALLVVREQFEEPCISLRIDIHENPVKELRRIFTEHQNFR